MSYLKIEKKRFTGIASFLVIGTLLLAACGPEATPTTTSTTSTIVPGTGATPTDVRGVITTPTISTDSPTGATPEASETTGTTMGETPGATMESTPGASKGGTPGATTEASPSAMAGETPEAMTTPGTTAGVGASYIVTMTAQNGSGQDGAAVVTDLGNGMVNVVVDIAAPGTTDPQPAHIHQGTCAQLDPQPAYPLSNVVNGKSVTEIEADFDTLTATPFAINVHK